MNRQKTMLYLLRGVLAVLLVLHLVTIFHFSAEAAPQSDRTSTSVIETLLQTVSPSFSSLPPDRQAEKVQSLQKTVRTLAHLAEFCCLGALLCALLLTFQFRLKGLLCGFFGCVLTAAGDEVHQLLIPGRTFQWADIAVDSFGAALGMAAMGLVVYLVVRIIKKTKQKRGLQHEQGTVYPAV